MKRILVVLLIAIMTIHSACNANTQEDANMINYETGVFHDKNWEEEVGTYQNDIVPDKETALVLAVQIFNSMEKSAISEKYTPQRVFYDYQDAIWIVSFWEESEATILGGECNIAIQREDGKVLRIWFGE